MDETIYVILKVMFDFALEVWFNIFSKTNSGFRPTLLQTQKTHFIVTTTIYFETFNIIFNF